MWQAVTEAMEEEVATEGTGTLSPSPPLESPVMKEEEEAPVLERQSSSGKSMEGKSVKLARQGESEKLECDVKAITVNNLTLHIN
eukprot:768754-Hanusia_phi.AAC.5